MNLQEIFIFRVSFSFLYDLIFDQNFFEDVLAKLVQFKLADIGEGIAEVEMKEW